MSPAIDHFAPFVGFYADAKATPPETKQIDGTAMPEPYRSLLVNEGDMTPTLENFHRCKLHLQVLGRIHVGDEYRRQVLLLDPQNRPVEFGAIRIHLDVLLPAVQKLVLAGQRPLGGVLIENSVPHSSRPSAYFSVIGDDLINRALGVSKPCALYGRCNTLTADDGRVIAEVVEILPPHRVS
jgi:chorismate-pyruvate lyase